MTLGHKIFGKYYDYPFIKFIVEICFVLLPIAFLIRTFIFGLYIVPTGSMEHTLLVGERFLADKFTYWIRAPKRGEIIACNSPIYQYSSNPFVKFWEYYVSWNIENWTKRVIGLPGEHIKGIIENGKPVIYINDVKLDEPYINQYPLIFIYQKPYYIGGQLRDKALRTFDPNMSWDQQPFYNLDPSQFVLNPLTKEPIILWPFTPEEKDVFDIQLGKDEYFVCGDNRRGSDDSRSWGPLKKELIHGKIIFRILSMDTDESWIIIDLIKNPINFFRKIRWSRCLQFVN